MRQRSAIESAGGMGARTARWWFARLAELALVVSLAVALVMMIAMMLGPHLAATMEGCGGVALPGCTASAGVHVHYPPTSSITSATTLRTSDFPSNRIAAFAARSSQANAVQRLYADLMALKRMPLGTYSCPLDSGAFDHVTFYTQGKVVLQALVSEQGCGWVNFGVNGVQPVDPFPTVTSDTRSTLRDTQFWPLFAAAFNANVVTLTNDVGSSGPYAPTWIPPIEQNTPSPSGRGG